jgi:hypothetical protein
VVKPFTGGGHEIPRAAANRRPRIARKPAWMLAARPVEYFVRHAGTRFAGGDAPVAQEPVAVDTAGVPPQGSRLNVWIVAGTWACIAMAAPHTAADPPRMAEGVRIAGHEPDINPALRRFTGMVVGLGRADASGHVYTLQLKPLGPGMKAPARDELRGWRMTVLAGPRFASVFWVQSNTATEITVRAAEGALDGLGERDVFVVEETDPNVPTSRRDGADSRVA